MIRVKKDTNIPASLQKVPCTKYDDEDVKEQLLTDHNVKCYLCEQRTGKVFEIEHLKPKADGCYPELKYTWTNLFLACPYCNGRKTNSLTLLDPTSQNIEEIIEHSIDFTKLKVSFSSTNTHQETLDTISLLDKLHNGKNGLRDIKTKTFFNDLQQNLIGFLSILSDYQSDSSDENKQAVIDSLSIKKEFLGFKFWMIKQNSSLYSTFKTYMIWNKPH